MKIAMNKQNALKASLLLVVAANLSWGPVMRSLNLSSSSEMADGKSAPPSAPAASTSTSNPPANAARPSAEGPKPDAPAKPSQTSNLTDTTVEDKEAKAPRSEAPKVCGQRFYVSYREIVIGGDTMTEIYVKPHTGIITGFKPFMLRPRGGFDTNLDNEDIKKDNDSKIATMIKNRLGRCPEEVQPAPAPEKQASKEDKEAIKSGMKACRLNSKGDPLSETQVVRCRLKQLDDIDFDRDDRRGSSKAMAQLEKIVRGDIRKSIKNRLMSSDESKVDEGEELLNEVVEQIKENTTEMNLDPYRMSKLVGELQSLRAGGETYRRSVDLDKQVKDVQSQLREELQQAQMDYRNNPRDPWAAQRLLQVQQDVMNQQKMLFNQAQMEIGNGPLAQLNSAQKQGYISLTEFSQFMQPYNLLRVDLMSMGGNGLAGSSNPILGNPSLGAVGSMNSATLPNDFARYRAGLATSFQQNYGVSTPIRPANIGSAPLSTFGTGSNALTGSPGLYNSGGNRWQ